MNDAREKCFLRDNTGTVSAFVGSFATDVHAIIDIEEMANVWVDLEVNEDFVDAMFEEEIGSDNSSVVIDTTDEDVEQPVNQPNLSIIVEHSLPIAHVDITPLIENEQQAIFLTRTLRKIFKTKYSSNLLVGSALDMMIQVFQTLNLTCP